MAGHQEPAVWLDGYVLGILIEAQDNHCVVCAVELRGAGPVLEWFRLPGGNPQPFAVHTDCVPEIGRTRNRDVREAADFLAGGRLKAAREALDAVIGCTEWFSVKRAELDSAAGRIAAAEAAKDAAEASASAERVERARAVQSETAAVKARDAAVAKYEKAAASIAELKAALKDSAAALKDSAAALKESAQAAESRRACARLLGEAAKAVLEQREPTGVLHLDLSEPHPQLDALNAVCAKFGFTKPTRRGGPIGNGRPRAAGRRGWSCGDPVLLRCPRARRRRFGFRLRPSAAARVFRRGGDVERGSVSGPNRRAAAVSTAPTTRTRRMFSSGGCPSG